MEVIERLINIYGAAPVILFGLLIVVTFISLIATIIYCARIAIRIEYTYEYEEVPATSKDNIYLYTDSGSLGDEDNCYEQNRRNLRVVGSKKEKKGEYSV